MLNTDLNDAPQGAAKGDLRQANFACWMSAGYLKPSLIQDAKYNIRAFMRASFPTSDSIQM
jgi:hypothetical protein